MLPCGMMPEPEVRPLEQGFESAWQQLRTASAKLRRPAKCAACEKREICSVCAAVCVTETGRFDGVPEYACQMTEELIRLTQKIFEKQ